MKKRSLINILIAIMFFAHMKVDVAAILDFFHFNLLVSNVYFGSTTSKSYYRQHVLRSTYSNSKYVKNDGYLVKVK